MWRFSIRNRANLRADWPPRPCFCNMNIYIVMNMKLCNRMQNNSKPNINIIYSNFIWDINIQHTMLLEIYTYNINISCRTRRWQFTFSTYFRLILCKQIAFYSRARIYWIFIKRVSNNNILYKIISLNTQIYISSDFESNFNMIYNWYDRKL